MPRNKQRRRPPAIHSAEDYMQKQFLSLKTALDLYGELEKLPQDKFIQEEVTKVRNEIQQTIAELNKSGYSMLDLIKKFGGQLYKSQLINAQHNLEKAELEKHGEPHHLVTDLINNEAYLAERSNQGKRPVHELVRVITAEENALTPQQKEQADLLRAELAGKHQLPRGHITRTALLNPALVGQLQDFKQRYVELLEGKKRTGVDEPAAAFEEKLSGAWTEVKTLARELQDTERELARLQSEEAKLSGAGDRGNRVKLQQVKARLRDVNAAYARLNAREHDPALREMLQVLRSDYNATLAHYNDMREKTREEIRKVKEAGEKPSVAEPEPPEREESKEDSAVQRAAAQLLERIERDRSKRLEPASLLDQLEHGSTTSVKNMTKKIVNTVEQRVREYEDMGSADRRRAVESVLRTYRDSVAEHERRYKESLEGRDLDVRQAAEKIKQQKKYREAMARLTLE